MKDLSDFECTINVQVKRLKELGIDSLQSLQKIVNNPDKCEAVTQKTGVNSKRILKWLNRKDLSRIRGLSNEYLRLLHQAGVCSVEVLAQCNADQLNSSMMELNEKRGDLGRLPGLLKVIGWVEQAKKMPKKPF